MLGVESFVRRVIHHAYYREPRRIGLRPVVEGHSFADRIAVRPEAPGGLESTTTTGSESLRSASVSSGPEQGP
jgi:hypothetical protein